MADDNLQLFPFPTDPQQDLASLFREITRENAIDLLKEFYCPYCRAMGQFALFVAINNNAVGIRCDACNKHHPFAASSLYPSNCESRIMWLRAEEKRPTADIVEVARKCGAYCYSCGATFDDLQTLGVGLHVHHTRPFAEFGEKYPKIPYCADCHEFANLMQRIRRRELQRLK